MEVFSKNLNRREGLAFRRGVGVVGALGGGNAFF